MLFINTKINYKIKHLNKITVHLPSLKQNTRKRKQKEMEERSFDCTQPGIELIPKPTIESNNQYRHPPWYICIYIILIKIKNENP